jgi:hypothetical protein
LAALGVIVIGPRKDILTAIYQPTFVWLAMATLGTALLSAMGAFVLSVPGAERSPLLAKERRGTRQAFNTGAAVPWSVPFELFSRGLRPNSE